MRFQNGDIVRIGKNTRYYGMSESNPRDMNGTTIEATSGLFGVCIDVRWDNGNINSYDEGDLKLVRRGNGSDE